MLLYEYQIRDEFTRVKELAERIRNKFDDASSDELLQDCDILGAAYEHLERLIPSAVTGGNFRRHLSFMRLYLGRDERASCRSDIDDICRLDLPALEKSFRNWAAYQQHYDAEFAEKVGPLLLERHLDSAVRKAFVLLKERLARAFGVSANLDGSELVNQVFGKNGYLAGQIPEPERESMRNLLDGLYGVFRNRYSHRDVEAEWSETEAVLSMINWSLRQIEQYPSVVTGQATSGQ